MLLPLGLRIPGDQRQITPALPMHLADVLTVPEGPQPLTDPSGKSQFHSEILCKFIIGL